MIAPKPSRKIPKVGLNMRISQDVLAAMRATGPGWSGRLDDMLRAHFIGAKEGGE